MQRLFSGELFLLFCKKSPKYQNNGVFKFPCTIGFVYVYRTTTSTTNTRNLFENNLCIFRANENYVK